MSRIDVTDVFLQVSPARASRGGESRKAHFPKTKNPRKTLLFRDARNIIIVNSYRARRDEHLRLTVKPAVRVAGTSHPRGSAVQFAIRVRDHFGFHYCSDPSLRPGTHARRSRSRPAAHLGTADRAGCAISTPLRAREGGRSWDRKLTRARADLNNERVAHLTFTSPPARLACPRRPPPLPPLAHRPLVPRARAPQPWTRPRGPRGPPRRCP